MPRHKPTAKIRGFLESAFAVRMHTQPQCHKSSSMENCCNTQHHYTYIPFSNDPQEGLKLVRFRPMIHSQLSPSNYKKKDDLQQEPLQQESQQQESQKSYRSQSSMHQRTVSSQSTHLYQQHRELLQNSYQASHQHYLHQAPQEQFIYQAPQKMREPQYADYTIQSLRYIQENSPSQWNSDQSTSYMTQSDYFFRKFQDQQLMCRHFKELTVKQQEEMVILKEALNKLQFIIVKKSRENSK